MIPLRDVLRSRTTPFIGYMIIAVNAVAFFYMISLNARELQYFFYDLGLVPYLFAHPRAWAERGVLDQLLPFMTSMFIHGGWLHIIGNMWTFFIFGDNVEDRMGHARFTLFYLLSGLVSVSLHLVTNWGSPVPVVGASGAIAGVMGAYLMFFPRARIVTLVPIFLLFTVVEIPAYFFLIFWFLLQFFSGAFALLGESQSAAGIAWWAHVGGFLFGVLFARAFEKPAPPKPDVSALARRFSI